MLVLETAKKDQFDLQENIEKAKRKRLAREHALAAKAAADAAKEAKEKQKEEEAAEKAKKRAEQGGDLDSVTVATAATAVSGNTNATPTSAASAVSDPAALLGADQEDALDVLLNSLERSDDELNMLLFPFGEAFQDAYALLESAQTQLVELLQLDEDGVPQVDAPLLPYLQEEADDHSKATRQSLLSHSIAPSKGEHPSRPQSATGSGTHTPTHPHPHPLPSVNFSSAVHTKTSLQWETIDLNAHPWYVELKGRNGTTPSHPSTTTSPPSTTMSPPFSPHYHHVTPLYHPLTPLPSSPPSTILTPLPPSPASTPISPSLPPLPPSP